MSVSAGVAFLSLHPSSASVAPVRRPCEGTSRRCRVGRNCCRWQKTPLPPARGPAPCSPPNMVPPPLSLPPLPPHLPPIPQETLLPHPHRFCRSPILPPQNRHRPRRRPDRHPRPHWRCCCLAPHPHWVRLYALQTLWSPHFRPSYSPHPALIPPPIHLSRISPFLLLSWTRAVVARSPAVA